MELNTKKYRAFMQHLAKTFKGLESELLAYRTVFAALKMAHFEEASVLDQAFQQVLSCPGLRKWMDEKYDPVLEKLLERIDESTMDQELLKWLQEWKPEGPIN
jgi:hypothetical protein